MGQYIVERTHHGESDQPGDVDSAQCCGNPAGIGVGRQKRYLHHDAEPVTEERRRIVAAVDPAVREEERRHVVVPVLDQIEIHQIDRRPRGHHAEQERQKIFVIHHEILGAQQRHRERQHDENERQDDSRRGVGFPAGPERLTDGNGRQDAAVDVHRGGRTDPDGKDHHDQDADGLGGARETRHDVLVRDGEAQQCPQQHRQRGSQHAAPVARPKRRPYAAVGRHVPGVVRHVGRVSDLPQRAHRDHSQEAARGQPAALPDVSRQTVDYQNPKKAGCQSGAAEPGHPARIGMYQVIPIDGGGHAQ